MLGWIVINPTLESVTEAKVTTADYDAEFGTAAAAVVSAQTKSGTNPFHGSAFEFIRNDHMQARNPFTQSVPSSAPTDGLIPVTQWNQFGGSIGGPNQKNKLFLFRRLPGDAPQHRRQRPAARSEPRRAHRRPERPRPQHLRSGQRRHAGNADAIPGNVIPLNRISRRRPRC